jgi:vesicle coat complex subunit
MLTSNLLNYVRIYRGALWILGEYCSTKEDIQSVMTEVRRSLGEVCVLMDYSFTFSAQYQSVA